jgi:hypothetical protein
MSKTVIYTIISIAQIIGLTLMYVKINGKHQNSQTQQYFNNNIPIESSSGPQVVDPNIRTFTALWDPQRFQNKMYIL